MGPVAITFGAAVLGGIAAGIVTLMGPVGNSPYLAWLALPAAIGGFLVCWALFTNVTYLIYRLRRGDGQVTSGLGLVSVISGVLFLLAVIFVGIPILNIDRFHDKLRQIDRGELSATELTVLADKYLREGANSQNKYHFVQHALGSHKTPPQVIAHLVEQGEERFIENFTGQIIENPQTPPQIRQKFIQEKERRRRLIEDEYRSQAELRDL